MAMPEISPEMAQLVAVKIGEAKKLNTSGFVPIWIRALVLPDKVEQESQGGILIPKSVQEKEEMKQIKGTLIAVGGNAFDDHQGDVPQAGDRIYFAKYAGSRLKSPDGQEYRIINGRDIWGIITEE